MILICLDPDDLTWCFFASAHGKTITGDGYTFSHQAETAAERQIKGLTLESI